MFATNAMSTATKSCKPDFNLEQVAHLMWEGDCGAMPVVDDENRPIGIITDRDIAMAAMLNHQPLWEIHAGALIKDQTLRYCQVNDQLEDCLSIMEQNSIRRLPVVNAQGALAGILSMGDVIAFASEKKSKAKNAQSVAYRDVIGMLKNVSAHHERPAAEMVTH